MQNTDIFTVSCLNSKASLVLCTLNDTFLYFCQSTHRAIIPMRYLWFYQVIFHSVLPIDSFGVEFAKLPNCTVLYHYKFQAIKDF